MTSKVIPIALQASYDSGYLRTAYFLRVVRTDAQVFAYTDNDQDLPIDAVTYSARPGLLLSNIDTTAGFAVDNLELTTLNDGTVFSLDEVLAGVWYGATFEISKADWSAPSDGVEPILSGTLGGGKLRDTTVVFELRGPQQPMQQPIGDVSTPTCRSNFADFPKPNGSNLCSLDPVDFTVDGVAVTSVTNNQQFTASGLLPATEDWYGEGILTWSTGDNAGLRQKVKVHTAAGALTLSLPMLLAVQVGDTFSIIAGCRKRHARTLANLTAPSDCLDKFDNVPNFQGEPHRPPVDQITAAPEVSS